MSKRFGSLIAVLLLILTATACGDDAPESRGTAVVTLDAFSGLPNPTWALAEDQAAELLSMWDDLATTTTTEYSGYLGYRGVIVNFADGSTVWVSRGVAVDDGPGDARADTDHALETWIIETGRATLDPALVESVMAEIAAG